MQKPKSTYALFVILATTLIGFIPSLTLAQEAVFTEADHATMVFDINVKQLRESEFLKQVDLTALMAQMSAELGVEIDAVDRFYAMFDLGDDFANLRPVFSKPFPVDFLWVVEFNRPDAHLALKEQAIRDFDWVEVNGKQYLTPRREAQNIFLEFGETRFVAGTDKYLFKGDEDFMTMQFADALKNLPADHAVKGGIDIRRMRGFIDSMYAFEPKDEWHKPPPAEFMALIRSYKHADTIVGSLDLDDPRLIEIIADSVDEQAAQKIENQFSQWLNMLGALGWMLDAEQIEGVDAEDIKQVNEFLRTPVASREGTRNKIIADRPEGFERTVNKLIKERMDAIADRQLRNGMREMGRLVHIYEMEKESLPFHRDAQLSWQAKVASVMDETLDFRFDEPWNSNTNMEFAKKMPACFGNTGTKTGIRKVRTNVNSFAGVTDGTSNTIMLLKLPELAEWTRPNDISIADAIKQIRAMPKGKQLMVVMYDSSVHQLAPNRFTDDQLQSLLTPAGGEAPVDISGR